MNNKFYLYILLAAKEIEIFRIELKILKNKIKIFYYKTVIKVTDLIKDGKLDG